MSYRFRRLVAFIALESWASHAASCPIHLITLSRTPCDYTSPNYHSQVPMVLVLVSLFLRCVWRL